MGGVPSQEDHGLSFGFDHFYLISNTSRVFFLEWWEAFAVLTSLCWR